MVSQLKRLKASLQAAGITGQQKPKKASKRRNQSTASDTRLDKNSALQTIREEFNPFEIKTTRDKHVVINQGRVKGKVGRPSLSKSVGEENRKKTLLVEMQSRNKAGAVIDRRFGENDPTMDPERKMMERFIREKTKPRGSELFNLEDDDDNVAMHFGQSLGRTRDDFDASGLDLDDKDDEDFLVKSTKRRLDSEEGAGSDEQEEEPARKKSKNEVMKEVIAKSKLHKYERQRLKEADQDEREKLDAQMGELWTLLGAKQPSTTDKKTGASGANTEPLPDRDEVKALRESLRKEQAQEDLQDGEDDDKDDKTYDRRVREMLFDKRSKPADRTKTAEERAEEESKRLQELEAARQKRMRGEESDEEEEAGAEGADEEAKEFQDDAAAYGLGQGIPSALPERIYDNPDAMLDGDYEVSEDGYVDVDEEGMVEGAASEEEEGSESGRDELMSDSEDEEFLADVLPAGQRKYPLEAAGALVTASKNPATAAADSKLAFTYPCPQSHKEMLSIVKDIPVEDHPVVVQRIRILHHPKLLAENKVKLAAFSAVLLEHIVYVTDLTAPKTPFPAIDTLIRHLHALAKSYPEAVSEAFRERLRAIHDQRADDKLTPGDLVLLTAIGTIYPTSDHFHQVVTPAFILICKWLAQATPDSVQRVAVGSYLVTLCLQYTRLSKRYVPEALNYVLQGLCLLAPAPLEKLPGQFPYHEPGTPFRISQQNWVPRKLAFADMFDVKKDTPLALLHTFIGLLERLADLWTGKNSFQEAFEPALGVLSHLRSKACKGKLPPEVNKTITSAHKTLAAHLAHAKLVRRPLELHHHRPLPIASNIPKFEEGYSLDTRSYDHDPERREQAKLKAEYKKERKGAIRELRKDSRFIAREKLREDKKTSQEYHAKMARLTKMVQTEEGAAANEYERQRRARQGKK